MTLNVLAGQQQWIWYLLSAALHRISPTLSVQDTYKFLNDFGANTSASY